VEKDEEKVGKIRREFKYYLSKHAISPYQAELYISRTDIDDPWITENGQYKFINSGDIFQAAYTARKEEREARKVSSVPAKVYTYTVLVKDSSTKKIEQENVPHTDLSGGNLYYVKFDESAAFEQVYNRGYSYASRLSRVGHLWEELGLDDN